MLRPFAHPVVCCWMLLPVVAQSLKPVKVFSQQLPTFLLFRDHRSLAQQCLIRLHSSSNIVGGAHAHYTRFTKTYGLYPSHDALQVPTLLGVVASVCTPQPTCTQQLPTSVCTQPKAACKRTQHCWPTTPNIVACYILRPFAHPVACCWMLLRVVAQSLKPVKLLAPCKRTQHCWELLRPFARSLSLQGLLVVSFP